MHKIKWNYKSSALSPAEINEFSQKNSISYVMSTVLLNRGIKTREQIMQYIGKSLEGIHNPMLLPDIEQACRRIIQAIENKEKIVIYGDYDVDGVTSTSLLYSFLKENGADVKYFIPDRIRDGYGLNIKAINKISKLGTRLLITVDCGITSVGEVELAKAQQMEVIVTDHHTCKERIPDAVAVVNPKRADSKYPFSSLAGVGVAFKLILGVTKLMGKSTKECFDRYCDLVAVGTIADVVDLQGENRLIVDRGLKKLLNTENYGIRALLGVCGANDKSINSTTIAFGLSPRINAAGRMAHASIAVDLLLSQSDKEAYEIALRLDELNRERQRVEKEIFDEALEMIEKNSSFSDKKIIVLAKEGWHHGVIGIVASRITEQFYKPCILIAVEGNGKGKGSGRSVEGMNLFDALLASEEHLLQFGGHSLAAGLSLEMKNFDAFYECINKYIAENLNEEPHKMLDIDCSVPPAFVSVANAKMLERLEPYGMSNPKPVFAMCGVKVVSAVTMGTDERHLRLKIEAGDRIIEAVGFSFGHLAKYLNAGRLIDIAFNLEVSTYQGNERLQLMIKDIKSCIQ